MKCNEKKNERNMKLANANCISADKCVYATSLTTTYNIYNNGLIYIVDRFIVLRRIAN